MEQKVSCDMQRMANRQAVRTGPPGGFFIEQSNGMDRTMYCKLPEGTYTWLSLRPTVDEPSWGWDENEERPTLHPSVHYRGHWHGWFREGRMVTID